MLRIAPEEAKALLLLNNVPANRDAEKLISADGRISSMFLPPSTTAIMQPMDLGVIVSCKLFYQRKFLDEVLVVMEEEENMEEDTRGQPTLTNIKTDNIKSAIYNIASTW